MQYTFSNESGEWKCEIKGNIISDINGVRTWEPMKDVSLSMAGVEADFEDMILKIKKYSEEN